MAEEDNGGGDNGDGDGDGDNDSDDVDMGKKGFEARNCKEEMGIW